MKFWTVFCFSAAAAAASGAASAPEAKYLDAVEAQFARVRATIPEISRAAEAVRERVDSHPGALIDMPCDLGFGFREEMIARAGGLAQFCGGHSEHSTVLVPVRSWEDLGERGKKEIRTWCGEGCLVVVIGSAAGRPEDLPASFFLDNGAPDGSSAHGTKNVLVNALLGWMFCCEYAAAHSRTGKFPAVLKSIGSRDFPIVNSHAGSSDGLTRYFPCPEKIPAGELATTYWNQAMLRFRQLREPHVQDGIQAAADAAAAALEQGRRVGVAGLGHLILEEPKHGLKSPMLGLRVVSMAEETLMDALGPDDLLVWISYFGLSTRHFDYTGPIRRARVKLAPSYSLPVPFENVPKGEAFVEQAWRVPDAEVAIPVAPGFMGSQSEIDRVVILRSLDEEVAARLASKGLKIAPCAPYDPCAYYDYAMTHPREVPVIGPARKGHPDPAPGAHLRTCGSGDQQLFCDDGFHWGAMKQDGTVTVPAEYDQLDGWRGGELLVAYKGGKYGVVDWNGRTVVPFEWDLIGGGRGWCTVAKNGRYGVMDMNTGALLTPCRYDWPAKAMGQDLVSANVAGREGLFTTGGRQLVAPTWDAVDGVRGVECLVRRNGRHRLVTTDGSAPKVAGEHDEIAFLPDGGYRILDDRRHGILAADGSVRIPQAYDRLAHEKDKGGVVRTLARRDGAWFLFEAKEPGVGELRPVPFPFAAEYVAFSGRPGIYRVAKDMRWGLVDAQGKVLAPLEYSYVHPSRWSGFRAAKGGTWSLTARELPTLAGASWGTLTEKGLEQGAFKPDPREFPLIP
ncbi:MAG: WG repeat-containing protein [Kiritimatiellae bacterium]|nr:WG repeat-containing protein [Kiritimatiellia bacterium]